MPSTPASSNQKSTDSSTRPPENSKAFYFGLAAIAGLAVLLLIVLAFIEPTAIKQKLSQSPQPQEEPGKEVVERALVTDFPDVPVYPEARVIESYAKDVESGKGYEALWISHDAPYQVASWYLDTLRSSGWEIVEPETIDPEVGEPYVTAQKGGQLYYFYFENTDDDDPTEIHLEIPSQS